MISTVKRLAKHGIKKFFAARGYSIIPTKDLGTMESSLRKIAVRNHTIGTVIDVGASDGSWSSVLMKHLPKSAYLLIEAQSVHRAALDRFLNEHENGQVVLAAAGDRVGKIYFDATDPYSGQASYTAYAKNNIEVPVTTIDEEVRSRKLPGPYLLKLDTHGFEVPILQGARATLRETEVIVVECYNFRIAKECLLFHEMCDHLNELGFRCIDLADPLYRPEDEAFWQVDLVFIRADRPEFRNA